VLMGAIFHYYIVIIMNYGANTLDNIRNPVFFIPLLKIFVYSVYRDTWGQKRNIPYIIMKAKTSLVTITRNIPLLYQ